MIHYHRTSDQIIFCVDEVASKEIFEWNRIAHLTFRQLTSLLAAGNPAPEYSVKLTLAEDEIILEIARDTVGRATVDRFCKTFNAQYQEAPIMNGSTGFLDALDTGTAFVLTVDFEHHKNLQSYHNKDLRDWNRWVDSEAFSGRYKYEFFYPGGAGFLSKGRDTSIIDTQNSEAFILYPWDDFGDFCSGFGPD